MIKGSVSFWMSPPTALFGDSTDYKCSSSPVHGHTAEVFCCQTIAAVQLNQRSAAYSDAL